MKRECLCMKARALFIFFWRTQHERGHGNGPSSGMESLSAHDLLSGEGEKAASGRSRCPDEKPRKAWSKHEIQSISSPRPCVPGDHSVCGVHFLPADLAVCIDPELGRRIDELSFSKRGMSEHCDRPGFNAGVPGSVGDRDPCRAQSSRIERAPSLGRALAGEFGPGSGG